ncbi:MAG: metal ABC transporter substrate-binding protein [Gemmataceae bacterium]
MPMRRVAVGALVFLAVSVVGCTGGRDPWADRAGPRVLAYFPPIYSFAASVAGEDAQVKSLITHIGPHHFEPTTQDALALKRTDLFLTVGLGLDDSVAQKLAQSSNNPKLKLVALGSLIPKDSLHEGGCNCHGHHHDASHQHDQVEYDPHVWLGIPEAQRMIDGIRNELAGIDSSHAEGYKTRAAAMHERLDKLLGDGKAMLSAKSEKPRLISFHDSLFYFARSFGIEVVDTIDLPGQDPSAKRLKELVDKCKEQNVRIIAVEPQYASRNDSARTIMKELKRSGIDAVFVEIDPLETADSEDMRPDFYERKMRANLQNLASVLK